MDETTTTTTTTSSNNNHDDPNITEQVDDEGLHPHYDIVICGTGLIQSILASSLSRYYPQTSSKKKVLHIDGCDHYGNLDAVYTYPYLVSQIQQQQQQQENTTTTETSRSSNNNKCIIPLRPMGELSTLQFHNNNDNNDLQQQQQQHCWMYQNTYVMTPYGVGKILSFILDPLTYHHHDNNYNDNNNNIIELSGSMEGYTTIVIQLIHWTLTNRTHPNIYTRVSSTLLKKKKKKILNSSTMSTTTIDDVGMVDYMYYIDDYQYMYNTYRICTVSYYKSKQILQQYSRSIAFDVTPSLLYAAGPAVDGLLQSNVSNYIEFKSLESILYYTTNRTTDSKTTKIASTTNIHNDDDDDDDPSSTGMVGNFIHVPCSKKDVFNSTLLSPLDKRRLMKFLHLALDYAGSTTIQTIEKHDSVTTTSNNSTTSTDSNINTPTTATTATTTTTTTSSQVEDVVQTWNERYLNQGRSLVRPQNKVVAKTELQYLQELCNTKNDSNNNNKAQGKSFLSYLQKDQQLSSSLTTLIQFALALDTNPCTNVVDDSNNKNNTNNTEKNTSIVTSVTTATSVKEGMEQLCAHMYALGRFGSTAFLVPLYGSGELSQAFCRSAAVYGTTYLLRRAPTAIVIKETTNIISTVTAGTSHNDTTSSKYIISGIQITKPDSSDNNETGEVSSLPLLYSKNSSSKQISCTHIVIPESSIQYPNNITKSSTMVQQQKRVLRRISIVTGKPVHLDQTNKQQEQQRHVLIIPPYSISSKQTSAIHGVVVDESVNVTPSVPGGCTIIHLTTSIFHDPTNKVVDDSVLSDAMNIILKSFRQSNNDNENYEHHVVEIFHTSFSYEVFVPHSIDDDENNNNNDNDVQKITRNCNGLHLIHRKHPNITVDDAFDQAFYIFQRLCPNTTRDDFLKVSQSTTEAIQETFGSTTLYNTGGDDIDDETMALNSALDMIQEQPTSNSK